MKESFYTESILYWAARAVSAVAQRLPARVNTAAGSLAGRLLYHGLASRRRVALDNLRAAFGDAYTPADYRRILRRMFRNFGMTFMEIAAIPRIDRATIDRWVTPSPGSREHMDAALAKGKGLILITGHFGNWELSSISGALYGYPTLVLAREQGWPKLNGLLVRYRESKGCKVVTKGFAVRELIQGLRDGKIIGILSDQDGGKNGTLAPLFARLASTAPGAIELSIRTGAPVVPIFIARKAGPAHELIAEEPLMIPEQGTQEQRVRAGVAAYLQRLEQIVRRHPDQWLWLHRRWKSTPERKILIFSDGKAGHEAQSRALAEKLAVAWQRKAAGDLRLKGISRPLVESCTAQIRFRNPAARALLAAVAMLAPRKFSGGDFWLRLCLTPDSYRSIRSGYADYSISCGAGMAAVNWLWARALRTRAIHINRVHFPSWRRFDLSVWPRHDLRPGVPVPSSVLVADGALVPDLAAAAGQMAEWKKRLGLADANGSGPIGLFIGGPPARGGALKMEDLQRAVDSLLDVAETFNAPLLVTTSRRTPAEMEEWLSRRLRNHPRCRLLTLVGRGQAGGLSDTAEAMRCILGLARVLVVSGDSISMVSEAVATGKPVVGFSAPRGTKYERFLRQMHEQGFLKFTDSSRVGEAAAEQIRAGAGRPAVPSDLFDEALQRWL